MTDLTVTLSTQSETPVATIEGLRDVTATSGYGVKGDAARIAAALAKVGKLSAAQVRAVEGALEYAIRRAGYHLSTPALCAVDFDRVALYAYGGERGGTVSLVFSGLAHAEHRDGPGRWLVAYDHFLTIGKRGRTTSTTRGGREVEGFEAVSNLDYVGRTE